MLLHLYIYFLVTAPETTRRLSQRALTVGGRFGSDRGQTTAEYALVLLGAASVALLIAVWARGDGGVGKLLDAVFGKIIKLVR